MYHIKKLLFSFVFVSYNSEGEKSEIRNQKKEYFIEIKKMIPQVCIFLNHDISGNILSG